jgi:predicted transcriptional regulator
MGNRSALDLMGPTERQILHILWRDGPSAISHIQTQLGGAPYTTVASPLQSLQRKGFVTKTGPHMEQRFHALPKQALLLLACERHLAELGATPTDRAHILEALRHG